MTINTAKWDDFVSSLLNDELPAAVKGKVHRPTARLAPSEAPARVVERNGAPRPAAQTVSTKDRFLAENAEVIEIIRKAASWSDFARSLSDALLSPRYIWSDKQLAAARSMAAKISAREAAKAATRPAPVTVDLSAIEAMFATAAASGYKKPAYRANGLVIKPHWEGTGLAVYNEERQTMGQFGMMPGYDGKVSGGTFSATRACPVSTPHKLAAIAADPKGEAIRHGQRTGRCSCCGRELTKHASIDLGIGPICAEKWGF